MEFGEGKRHSLYLFLRAKKPFLKEDCGQNWVRVQLLNHSLTKKKEINQSWLITFRIYPQERENVHFP